MPICSACHRHDLPCEGILLLQCDSHCFRTSRHHASKSLPIPFAAVCVQSPLSSLHEQDLTELNDLKAKVCRTGTAKLCAGLPQCSKLDGTNFYLYPRDRTLNLQDYRRARSTISSRRAAFNPETRRPWIKQDADGQARLQKTRDHRSGANCAAVASLPSFRQKLKELEQRQ